MLSIAFNGQWPFLYLFVFALIAAGLSWVLYFWRFNNQQVSKSQRWVLVCLRFFSIWLLLVLMLNPVINSVDKVVKKPIIIIACDNSQSIKASTPAPQLLKYESGIGELTKTLSEQFEVMRVNFSDQVTDSATFSYSGYLTNFEPLFNRFYKTWYNINVGALVLASDGLFNSGSNPANLAISQSLPIYTIPLGDTTRITDVYVKEVEANKKVYAGTRFPVLVSIEANNLVNEQVSVSLYKGKNLLESKNITLSRSRFFEKISFLVNADSSGLYDYSIKVTDLPADQNKENNSRTFFVNVEQDKLKILILQNGPHPDIGAIFRVLEKHPAFEPEIAEANGFNKNPNDYALVVLHQLPSAANSMNQLLSACIKSEIPMLFIVGQKTSVQALNQLNIGYNVVQKKQATDQVTPSLNPNFSLFTPYVNNQALQQFPPLTIPFGDYQMPPNSSILLTQKIGMVETPRPLWYFAETGGSKIGFIGGEGIWRWQLAEYANTNQVATVNELISKTVQYLALKVEKQRLIIDVPDFSPSMQPVIVGARLFNEANEPVNQYEVKFEITDGDNHLYQYIFQPKGVFYQLNLGNLATGKYQYKATAVMGNEEFTKTGRFFIGESSAETANLVANHRLLYQLSAQSNGKMVPIDSMAQIAGYIQQNQNVKPMQFFNYGFTELLNNKWFFVVLLVLLVTEWFLRKFWGLK